MWCVVLAPSDLDHVSSLAIASPNSHDSPNQENTKERLEIEKQSADKSYITGPISPTDLPSVSTRESRRGKRKYVWDRVKRIIVRHPSP